MNDKKVIYKNPWFWISGCLVLLIAFVLIASLVFFIIRSSSSDSEAQNYKQDISSIWDDIDEASSDLIDESEKVKDKETLVSFKSETQNFEDALENAKQQMILIDTPEEFNDGHKDLTIAIDNILDYAQELNLIVKKDTSQVNNYTLTGVGNTGVDAKSSEQNALAEFGFLEELPEKVYEIRTDLQTVYKNIWEEETQEQKAAKEAKIKKTHEQNKAIAKNVVNNYMAAYLKQNKDVMKTYLYGEALNEFDPEMEQYGDSEVISYEIASSDITPLNNYRFYVNITAEDVGGVRFADQSKLVVGKIGSDFMIIRNQWVKKLY